MLRVKWICDGAMLGGPAPMEYSGEVFHIDDTGPAGGRLTLRNGDRKIAYLYRNDIYEAVEL